MEKTFKEMMMAYKKSLKKPTKPTYSVSVGDQKIEGLTPATALKDAREQADEGQPGKLTALDYAHKLAEAGKPETNEEAFDRYKKRLTEQEDEVHDIKYATRNKLDKWDAPIKGTETFDQLKFNKLGPKATKAINAEITALGDSLNLVQMAKQAGVNVHDLRKGLKQSKQQEYQEKLDMLIDDILKKKAEIKPKENKKYKGTAW